MKPNSLEAFYASFSPVADTPGGAVPPPDIERAMGHFNVFNLAELMPRTVEKLPMPFDRRAYHKISFCRGRTRVEYLDCTLTTGYCSPRPASPTDGFRSQLQLQCFVGVVEAAVAISEADFVKTCR